MLLGFKHRFEPFILAGTKQHTIRGYRKNPPRVGQMCDCYVDARRPTMRLLGRWPCVKLQDIIITGSGYPDSTFIRIAGVPLDEDEREALAWADGFRCDEPFDEMLTFWRKEHGKGKPLEFYGQIIHWRWDKEGLAKCQLLKAVP